MRCILLALALTTSVAHASVLDIYGFNPRARAMGNAQTAVADDYTAVFYNPAGLTRRKKVSVGFGFIATTPQLKIDREYTGDQQRNPDGSPAIPHMLPPSFAGYSFGALFPLGGLIGNRVALGFGMYMPTINLLRSEAVDAAVPQYYRYQNLPDKFVMLSSAAFEVNDWLSVGAGVQVLAMLDGDVSMNLDLTDRRVREQTVTVDIGPVMAPTAGVLVQPMDGLSVGASYRRRLQLDYKLPSRIIIDDLLSMDIDIAGTVLYIPDYYNLGVAYDIEPANLLISGDVSFARWSQAPDPSPTFTLDISGELVEGLGLGDRLDVGNGAPVELNFRDVPIVKIGVEQRPHPKVKIRAGYTWRPTPAPVPTEAFNYLDNDAHILGVGFGFTFADPLEVRRNPIHLDVVYQATILVDQQVTKRAGSDDLVGDFTTGGTIHSFGFSFRHDL